MPEPLRVTRERVRTLLAAVERAEPAAGAAAERLAALRAVREAVDTFEADALVAAREAGLDWAEIGGALGMSGQAAGKRSRQRYQIADPRTAAETGRPATRGTYRPRSRPGPAVESPAVAEPAPEPAPTVEPPAPGPVEVASTQPAESAPAPATSGRRQRAPGAGARPRRRRGYTGAELDAYHLEPVKSESGEVLRYRVLIAGDDLGSIERPGYGRSGWLARDSGGAALPHTGPGRYAANRQAAVVDLLAALGITGQAR